MATKKSSKPNFVFFITDQHRADFLGCYGHPVLKTPHIDSLAARGSLFERFYVANPVCQPNRSTLVTGRMPSVHGVRCNGIELPVQSNTFLELLHAGGYSTALAGKSHLQNMTGLPAMSGGLKVKDGQAPPPEGMREARKSDANHGVYDQENPSHWDERSDYEMALPFYGFDHVDLCTGHGDEVGGDYNRWLERRHPNSKTLRGPENALPHDYTCPQAYRTAIPEELYPTSYITQHSLAFLDRQAAAGDNKPFFLMVSYPDPHHPFTPPGKYWDMYKPEDMKLPPSFNSNEARSRTVQWAYEQRDSGKAVTNSQNLFAAGERDVREAMALTCGMISMIDDGVGTILAKLKELGLDENTVVVFTSDHGDLMGDHQLLLKGPIHFHGLLRVPFIWADPAESGARRSDALCGTVDIASTILDRAGLAPYVGVQGRSLLPEISGAADGGPGSVVVEAEDQRPYFSLPGPVRVRTLVTRDHRFTVYQGLEWGELYDLSNDPHEMHNLWDDPAAEAQKSALFRILAERLIELADTSPAPIARA